MSAGAIMADLRRELEDGAQGVLSQVEAALTGLTQARAGAPGALDTVEAALYGAMEACAFADLTAQRISQLEPYLNPASTGEVDPLLQGPSAHGQGLDQSSIDRLLAEGA